MEDFYTAIAQRIPESGWRQRRACGTCRERDLLESHRAKLKLLAGVRFEKLRTRQFFPSAAQHEAAHRAASVLRKRRWLPWRAELRWRSRRLQRWQSAQCAELRGQSRRPQPWPVPPPAPLRGPARRGTWGGGNPPPPAPAAAVEACG